MASTVRERAVDVAIVMVVLLCAALLVATLKMLLVYIVCGLLFMAVAGYTASAIYPQSLHSPSHHPIARASRARQAVFPRVCRCFEENLRRVASRDWDGMSARARCSCASATGPCRSSSDRQRSRHAAHVLA